MDSDDLTHNEEPVQYIVDLQYNGRQSNIDHDDNEKREQDLEINKAKEILKQNDELLEVKPLEPRKIIDAYASEVTRRMTRR